MWDPLNNEEETPWGLPREGSDETAADIVPDDMSVGAPPPPPPPSPTPQSPTSMPEPSILGLGASTPPPTATPPTPAPTVAPIPAPTVAPPAFPPMAPPPTSLNTTAPATGARAVSTPTNAAPSAFTAIGAPPTPQPSPAASVTESMPTVAPRPAGTPLATAPSVSPSSFEVEAPKRRRWPWAFLALGTIAASGLVAWAVASSVQPEPAPAAVSAAEVPTAASPSTAPSAAQIVDVDLLANEPFANAAEIIRPSVVRLELPAGLGTGVIINSNGTILTAAHVVGDEDTVTVIFSDGSSVEGEVVGTHEPTDVAVVSVDPAGRTLVPAELAAGEDVRVGQLAVAVGSPFGFDQTVTAGIISAVDRLVPGSDASFVQTDAPINPGNSGGPLINLNGEVVGINDLIFTESGDSAGVGFAISIDLAIIIADQIVQGIEPQVALLGVSTGPTADGSAGALVNDVGDDTAAGAAGVQVGDIVVGVNGTSTRGSADLRAQIIDLAPGSDVTLAVIRDGESIELSATLGETGQ